MASGAASYVLDVDAPANRVVVGPGELLARRGLRADRVSWVAGSPPAGPVEASVKVRYRGEDVPAVVAPTGRDEAVVEFRTPQRAIAPGQSAVFYAGDEVLGGGVIAEPLR